MTDSSLVLLAAGSPSSPPLARSAMSMYDKSACSVSIKSRFYFCSSCQGDQMLNLIPRTSTWEFWNSGSPISNISKTGQEISEYIVQPFDVSPVTDSNPIFHFDTDPDPVRLRI
jgi:hypothetical protein